MIAFLDTSVVLRKLFNEPGQLREWRAIKTAYASRLMPLEVGRVIDRYRLQGKINDEEVASLNEEFNRVRRSLEIVALGEFERPLAVAYEILFDLGNFHGRSTRYLRR